jgi:xanthine dehydrogenase molybdenum-binding subunit
MLKTATEGITQDINPTYEIPVLPGKLESLFPGLKPEDLDIRDGVIFEKNNPDNSHTVFELVDQTQTHVTANPMYQAPFLGYGFCQGGAFGIDMPYRERLARQSHYAEIAVDTETGAIEVLKIVNVNDVGKVIDPLGVEAQQYGGTYMGLGRCMLEEGIYDPSTGVRLSDNIIDYKIPTMRDFGPIETYAIETALGYGPYGCLGVGESCSDLTSHIIAPALQNAIGVWIDTFPITPDKVLKALGKA